MFQIIEGIVKITKVPNVLGIADGKGMFLWLPRAEIKGSHPMTYNQWQTTRFAISPEYKVNWKPEKDWDKWAYTYNPDNIIPIPQPIPAEFAIEPQLQPQYQPTQPARTHPHINIPNYNNAYNRQELPTVSQTFTPRKMSPVVGEQQNDRATHNDAVLRTLRVMSDNIYKILQLFEKFMAPPTIQTADTLVTQQMTQEQVYEQYGEPPDDDYDNLPSIL